MRQHVPDEVQIPRHSGKQLWVRNIAISVVGNSKDHAIVDKRTTIVLLKKITQYIYEQFTISDRKKLYQV